MTELERLVNSIVEPSARKEKKEVVVHRNGIGLCGVLFIVFLVLKLTNTIAWSWWWVTAPLWIPIGLVVGIFTAVLAILIVLGILKKLVE